MKLHVTFTISLWFAAAWSASAFAQRDLLNSTTGLALWTNGKPTPAANDLTLELPPGRQTITLAVNRKLRPEALRIELADAPGSKAQAQLVGGK